MSAGNRSVLWVGKAPFNGGGDEIYDRKVIAALDPGLAVERFPVAAQSKVWQVRALLRGLPHPRFKYASPAIDRAFRSAAARHSAIVISWESFEPLALLLDRPVTLVVHNVMSDILAQLYGDHPVLRLAALQSRRWEQAVYARRNLRIVALSQRDRDLIGQLGQRDDIAVASPGTPPVVPLQTDRLVNELVISGSYDWRPKRADFCSLAREVGAAGPGEGIGWRHDGALPVVPEAAPVATRSTPIAGPDYADGLRFGVIPDTFLGGFKLKATYFIANNCMVLSRCDIRHEFKDLPHSSEFVRYTPTLVDILAAVATFRGQPVEPLLARWRVFQAACAERFAWSRAGQTLTDSLA